VVLLTLRCIGEKFYELNVESHLIFIDSKQAYDSINRIYLYEILEEFRIPKKLVKLVKMTLQDSNGKVKIQGQLTETFGIERGLRQVMHCVQHCLIIIIINIKDWAL